MIILRINLPNFRYCVTVSPSPDIIWGNGLSTTPLTVSRGAEYGYYISLHVFPPMEE